MNTFQDHAAAVMRQPAGPTATAIAGAITAAHAELLGELDRLARENERLRTAAGEGRMPSSPDQISHLA